MQRMAYRQSKSDSLRRLLAGLAAVSILLFLLPTRWTSGLIGLVQLIVPLQDATTSLTEATTGSIGNDPATVRVEDFESVQRQAEAHAHQVAALSARVEELEREVKALSATRHWNVGGTRIGTQGRLIPARVIVDDLLAWRSSKLTTTGSLQGVHAGAPVLSNAFSLGRGDDAGLRSGMAILLGEVFLGWVEKVGPHVSRVKLLSDPSVQMKVRIGRFTSDRFSFAEGYYWLMGRGDGRMEIRDVEARSIQAAAVEVGDVVLSDPSNESLPAALTIGTVSALIPDRDNPLFMHLDVRPVLLPSQLDRVFIFDPSSEDAELP